MLGEYVLAIARMKCHLAFFKNSLFSKQQNLKNEGDNGVPVELEEEAPKVEDQYFWGLEGDGYKKC